MTKQERRRELERLDGRTTETSDPLAVLYLETVGEDRQPGIKPLEMIEVILAKEFPGE
jgi:hypothetical protein